MPHHDDPFTIFDLIAVARREWKLMISALALVAIPFTGYAVLAKPVYVAEVKLISAENLSVGALPSMFGGIGNSALLSALAPKESRTVEAVATLRSRKFIRSFIQSGAYVDELFAGLWDPTAGTWKDGIEEERVPSVEDAVTLFREEILYIDEDPSLGTYTVSVRWTDRDLAARWANDLVENLNQVIQGREISEAEKMVEYLTDQLQESNLIELRKAIAQLLEEQINRITVAKAREEFVFTVIDPAVVPDEDDFVHPQRFLIVLTGCVGGVVLGLFLALLWRSYRSQQPA